MAVLSMNSCGGATTTRLAVIFALICAIFLLHDFWLPAVPIESIKSLHNNPSKDTTPSAQEIPLKEDPSTVSHTDQESYHKDDEELYSQHAPECSKVKGADKVMIILKTGATEIYQKLPTHFVTLLRCTPHYLIFSDLEQRLADYHIHDAIETVREEYREHHEDFKLYRKLQQYQREGQQLSKLKGDKGWNLDKWKFLPMLHRTLEMSPDKIDWFVYIEADTSLSWTNLLQWLKKMDPKDEYYLGAQNVIGPQTFGHGGSGFVLSRAAAEKFERVRRDMGVDEFDAKWEKLTSESCCGDEVVARALEKEADIKLTPAWPLLQGEKVTTLDWTDRHWCTPPITMHHVLPMEVDAMWQYHQKWVEDHGWQTPYLFRDLFSAYITRHISVNRTSWNNLSQWRKYIAPTTEVDISDSDDDNQTEQVWEKLKKFEQESTESLDKCAAACKRQKECVQWKFEPGRCFLDETIRLGYTDERENKHWESGWIQERSTKWHKNLEPCTVNWHG